MSWASRQSSVVLEENDCIYPSDTQVAVFVSLSNGEDSRLDSVQIQIDGEAGRAPHLQLQGAGSPAGREVCSESTPATFPTGEHQLGSLRSLASCLAEAKSSRATETFSYHARTSGRSSSRLTLATKDSPVAPCIELGGW